MRYHNQTEKGQIATTWQQQEWPNKPLYPCKNYDLNRCVPMFCQNDPNKYEKSFSNEKQHYTIYIQKYFNPFSFISMFAHKF